MLAPIAVQSPQPTEAQRSQTSDARDARGKFADILDDVQAQATTKTGKGKASEDAPAGEVKSDPAPTAAVLFVQPLADEAIPTGARNAAEQALVAAAAETTNETGAADAGVPTSPSAAAGTDDVGEFPEALDAAQPEDTGDSDADADAAEALVAKLRAAGDGGTQAADAHKTDAPEAGPSDDAPSAPPTAGPQQSTQGDGPARHGSHPVDMQPLQFDVKPAFATVATAQPHPTTQAVQVPLDGVAVQIAKAATDGIDRFRIELHPASLGGVDISLEIGRDGRVDAVVRADRPETLDLLQRDARQLARALQDAGLQADSGSFSFQRRDEGGRQPSLFTDTGGPRGRGSDDRGVAPDTIYRTVRPSGVDLRV